MATKLQGEVVENVEHSAPARQRLPRGVVDRIVVLFAQFRGVAEVQRAIREEFGCEIAKSTLQHYDADNFRGRLSKRHRALHEAAREAWIGETKRIGIAHQSQRLRLIERAIAGAERSRDWGNVSKLLELAAKEMGGVLTNVSKTEVRGVMEHRHMSIEDARSELTARLAGALDGGVLKPLELQDNRDDQPDI